MRVKEYLCTQIIYVIMTTTETLLLVMAVVVLAMGIVVTVMMWQSHHRRKLLRRREEIIEREQYAVDRLACEARSQGLDPGDTPAPTHRETIKFTDSI